MLAMTTLKPYCRLKSFQHSTYVMSILDHSRPLYIVDMNVEKMLTILTGVVRKLNCGTNLSISLIVTNLLYNSKCPFVCQRRFALGCLL